MNKKTHAIASAAIIGAAYALATAALAPISYGAVQFRVSEALCILPYFMPCTAWGLFAGCALANILTGNVFDVVFGSLATLTAALLTSAIGRGHRSVAAELAACFMPVIINALIVGAVITYAYNGLSICAHGAAIALNAAQVGFGEAAVMLLLGFPLMRYLPKRRFFTEFAARAGCDAERRERP